MNKFSHLANFEVWGGNIPLLLDSISKQKIEFSNLKQIGRGRIKISVPFIEKQKFIDLLQKMWYYKLIGFSGKGAFFAKLKKRVFLIIGLLVFLIGIILCDNLVYSIDILGDKNYFLADINLVLEQENIKKYSKFSDIDYTKLNDKIYSQNPQICFVSSSKSGNKLIITVKKSIEKPKVIDTTQKEIIADIDGVIFSQTIYRGVGIKNVGDSIKKGDRLAVFDSDYLLGRITILATKKYNFECKTFTKEFENICIMKALFDFDNEVYEYKTQYNNQTIIVEISYLVTLVAG